MNPEPRRPRLPALTSLRFFAALHVLIFHLYAMKIAVGQGWYHKLASIGYVGVSFFFVLSGFILVYTYAGRPLNVRDFWQARFARIYPAYLFSLLLTAPAFFYVSIALKNMDIPYYAYFKAHLLQCSLLVPVLLQSWVPGAALAWNSPAWSLSVEAFFYLMFPLLVVWLARSSGRALSGWIVGSWLLSLSLSFAYVLLKPDGVAAVDDNSMNLMWLNTLKFNPALRLPEFVMGVCLGFLFLRDSLDRKWASGLVLLGLAGFAAIVTFSPRIPYPILHDALLAPAFGAIIYGLALRPNWSAALEFKPLVLLGDASYSLYLLHAFAVAIYFMPMGTLRQTSPLGFALGILTPIVLSILVYGIIEWPARRWLGPKRKPEPVAKGLIAEVVI